MKGCHGGLLTAEGERSYVFVPGSFGGGASFVGDGIVFVGPDGETFAGGVIPAVSAFVGTRTATSCGVATPSSTLVSLGTWLF